MVKLAMRRLIPILAAVFNLEPPERNLCDPLRRRDFLILFVGAG
jgi:hypothetical protein